MRYCLRVLQQKNTAEVGGEGRTASENASKYLFLSLRFRCQSFFRQFGNFQPAYPSHVFILQSVTLHPVKRLNVGLADCWGGLTHRARFLF